MLKVKLNDSAHNRGELSRLSKDKVYEAREDPMYPYSYQIIADDLGASCLYHKRRFEVVVPPVKPTSAEATPDGKDMNAPGAKADAGKLLPRLVLGEFARALTEVVKVGTYGARKYTPRGWLEVENGRERYAEAADRHQLAVNRGEVRDDGVGGTGELHKAQVIWNLLAELELELRGK